MTGLPGASRNRGPGRPSSATIGAALVRRFSVITAVDLHAPRSAVTTAAVLGHHFGVTTAMELRAHRFAVTTAVIPPVPHAMGLTAVANARIAVNAALRFAETTGRSSPAGATPAPSPRALAGPAREARAVTATKVRRGTRARSRAAAVPSRPAVPGVVRGTVPGAVHRQGPVADHLFAPAHHEVKARPRNGAATPVGQAVPADRRPVPGVRGARAMAVRDPLAGLRIVAVGQVAGPEAVAAPAAPRATRPGGLVVGRDL